MSGFSISSVASSVPRHGHSYSRQNSLQRNSYDRGFNEQAIFIDKNVHRQGMNQIMNAIGSKLRRGVQI